MTRHGASLGAVPALIAIVLAVAAVTWRATGGSFYAVTSASMGTTAPVGSLALDAPAQERALHVGDLISFHPPGSQKVFTHRIVALSPAGIRTRGDVNGAADGWLLRPGRVLGRVIAVVPGAGWFVEAAPLLALGIVLVWVLTRFWVAPEGRLAARTSGIALVTVLVLTSLHVLVNSSIVSFARDGRGAGATVVSSGLLPLRVTASGGSSQLIGNGEVARVWTGVRDPRDRYHLQVTPEWEAWWMLPVGLLAILPGLLALSIPEPTDADPTPSARGAPLLAAPALPPLASAPSPDPAPAPVPSPLPGPRATRPPRPGRPPARAALLGGGALLILLVLWRMRGRSDGLRRTAFRAGAARRRRRCASRRPRLRCARSSCRRSGRSDPAGRC